MINSKKMQALALVLMLAFLFLWQSAGNIATGHLSENVSLRYDKPSSKDSNVKGGISIEAIKELPKDNEAIPKIMLWNESPKTALKNDHEQLAFATMLQIYGSNLLSLKMTGGSPLSAGDKSGCVIDEQAAYSLFGTVDVVGRTVFVEEMPYTVRGIFKTNEPLIMINSRDENAGFLNAELLFADTKNGRDDASLFISTYSMPSPSLIIDGSLIAVFMKLIIGLPALLIMIFLIARMLSTIYKVRNQAFLFAISLVAGFGISAALIFIFDISFSLPIRFIPSRWSDFSFWGSWFDRIIEYIKEFAAFQKTVIDNELSLSLIKLVCISVAMLFSMILLLERINIKTCKQLFSWSSLSILATFGACALTKSDVYGRGLFLALPCCFLLDFLINKWELLLLQKEEVTNENSLPKTNKSYAARFITDEEEQCKELA